MKTYKDFAPTSFDPRGLALPDQQDWLVLACCTRYLFQLDENSQFYSRWSVYVHDDEIELLNGGDDNGDE